MRRLAIVAVVLGGPRDSILRRIALVLILGVAATLAASTSRALQASDPPLFDPVEFLDQSTLDEAILQDWHIDTVNGATRQKLIEINVAEWWPGQDFRIPVRLIVPLTGTATGFHITGDHAYSSLDADAARTLSMHNFLPEVSALCTRWCNRLSPCPGERSSPRRRSIACLRSTTSATRPTGSGP